MDRQALDALYRALPAMAFSRALAVEKLDAVHLSFLREHVDELDFNLLMALRNTPVEEGTDPEWLSLHVVERLRLCANDEAPPALYEWLGSLPPGAHGVDFEFAFERYKVALNSGDLTRIDARQWPYLIGRHLTTGKAWKNRGRAVVEALVDCNRGFPPNIVVGALGGATSTDGATAEEHRTAIVRTIHEVAADVLVRRAEMAMKSREWDASRRFLSALATLDPGSYIGGPVHHLRKIPDSPNDVERLVAACEELARSGNKAPTEDALREAFIVLYGGLP